MAAGQPITANAAWHYSKTTNRKDETWEHLHKNWANDKNTGLLQAMEKQCSPVIKAIYMSLNTILFYDFYSAYLCVADYKALQTSAVIQERICSAMQIYLSP